MCLVATDWEVKELPEETTFYKVLVCHENIGSYFSPHEYMPIEFGVDYEIPEDTDFDIIAPVTPGECCDKYVEGGCYHLFVHSDDAYRDAQFLTEGCMWLYTSPDSNKGEKKYTYRVVKAIVPKGTKYIKGTYGRDEAICVRKVRYEKIENDFFNEI